MSQSNKSPYEIRCDVFAMTKAYMDALYKSQRETAEELYKLGEQTRQQYMESLNMYTPEQLLKQAEEFYSKFICKK